MAINEEFRKQKIEIAFPQQDVNIKGLQPYIEAMKEPHVTLHKKAA